MNLFSGLKPSLSALQRCLISARKRFHESDSSFRIFHGRGKSVEGLDFLTIDYFQRIVLITLFSPPSEAIWRDLIEIIDQTLTQEEGSFDHLDAILVQRRYRKPSPDIEILYGCLPEKNYAIRSSLRFRLELSNQNVGFFLDAEPARLWLEKVVRERKQSGAVKVLNLFSYTCAFSVVAKASGADEIVNIDMAKSVLKTGQANHQINSLPVAGVRFLPWNILKSWKKISQLGEFDIVIIDPPSFQRGSFEASRDYPLLFAKSAALLSKSGVLLACLNSPRTSAAEFRAALTEGAEEAGLEFNGRLEASRDFPNRDVEAGLKMLVYSASS